MTDFRNQTTALANLLEERLRAWEDARREQEQKMLDCYQDVLRIPREDDVKGTGAARTKKTQGLFIGSTRNKVRAARAKINDALFGNGSMPFDTMPTDEKLAPFADVVEDILEEQLERMKFKAMLKTGVNTLATYGTGFLFGPFVRKEKLIEASVGEFGLTETEYAYDFPYFELGNTLDVYPDPEARDIPQGLGVFWTTMESVHTVGAWADDKTFQNIALALVGPGDRGNETGSDIATGRRGVSNFWHKNERIKVARFFGKVPRRMMPDVADPLALGDAADDPPATAKYAYRGTELVDVAPDDDVVDVAGDLDMREAELAAMVDAIVIMAGGVVVKVTPNPYGGKSPALRCVYEAVEHEMWGVGVAENNMPHQKVTNAAFRLFMEGKGMALLGTTSVDRSAFLPTENFVKFPGKVYQFKPGLSPEQRRDAIQFHAEQDITGGWVDVIRMSEQFSDDDTGITKYTQGDDSSNLNKTATGISMIMSASSLPIKEVIQNIDEMWTEPVVECLIDWNLKYLDPETVAKIHGEEAGQKWAQIKQFGKSSFMDWQATGTSSFMQKEVLTNKIRAFAEFAMSNPATAPLIDARELLQQTWDVMEIGRESPILKEEANKELPPDVKQRMQQVSDHVDEQTQQIQKMGAALDKAHEDLRKAEQARMKAEIDSDKAQALLAIEKAQAQGATPDVADMVNQAVAMALANMMEQGAMPQPVAATPPQPVAATPMDDPMAPQDPMADQGAPMPPEQGMPPEAMPVDGMPPEGMPPQ